MNEIDRLPEELQKRCENKGIEDLAPYIGGVTYFLTNIFEDGCFLGFWSHSPWGRCHDQEQGWVVLSKDLKILEECETKSFGATGLNDFKWWRKQQITMHGKSRKLVDDADGEQIWKITGL